MIVKGDNLFYLMKNLLNITTRLINQQQQQSATGKVSSPTQQQQAQQIKDSWIASKAKYVSRLFKMIFTFWKVELHKVLL